MIKYKNLFLAVICIAAGTLAIMTNLHRPNKNMVKSITKLNDNYKMERFTINKQKSNLNMKNLNYSLNGNKNGLNNIVFNSEERVYGFKSIYTLATIPHKIIKAKKTISNINKKVNKNNIKINSEIRNIKTEFVSNETISYSNYERASNINIMSTLNFGNITSNNNTPSLSQDKVYITSEDSIAAYVITGVGAALIGFGAFAIYKIKISCLCQMWSRGIIEIL